MSILLSALISTGDGGGGAVSDGREFKRWQDFYGENDNVPTSYVAQIGQSTRSINGVSKDRRIGSGGTTWTVPSGVTKIRVTSIGAGGGGGRYSSTYHGSGGGAGGSFSSGEFNVTAGQTLNISVGKSGHGISRNEGGGTGVAGQQTIVEMTAPDGGSGALYVQAPGGAGGPPTSGQANAGGSGQVSGSLLSGGSITNNGGAGGNGNGNAIGWGPEGYGGGGGGSAGSFKGNGFRGGHGSPGYGYTFTGASGGGIGGEGIRAFGSQTASDYYSWSGGGGGSAGAGYTGTDNDSNPNFASSQPYGKGGDGTNSSASVEGYTYDFLNTDGTSYGKQFGDQHANPLSNFKRMNGARYGDGEGTATGTGGSNAPSGVTYNQYEAQFGIGPSSGGSSGFAAGASSTMTGISIYPAKMFNGILGRCQGGGGAGVGSKATGPNGGQSNSYSAGQGGAGGGGGGAACQTSNGNGNWVAKSSCHKWNPVDMAHGWTDTFMNNPTSSMRAGGCGGSGGALGGGGSCTNYGSAGPGGIGAGGGGASGHHSGGSYNGNGGDGGPGYVLIEW